MGWNYTGNVWSHEINAYILPEHRKPLPTDESCWHHCNNTQYYFLLSLDLFSSGILSKDSFKFSKNSFIISLDVELNFMTDYRLLFSIDFIKYRPGIKVKKQLYGYNGFG